MKRLLFLLFLIPQINSNGQTNAWKPIAIDPQLRPDIPEPDHDLPAGTVYITSSARFLALFDNEKKAKLPVIAFDSVRLRTATACMQCLISCGTSGPGCHRNRCNFQTVWYSERLHSPTDSLHGCYREIIPPDQGLAGVLRDSAVITGDSLWKAAYAGSKGAAAPVIDFSKYVVLWREANADCKANFENTLSLSDGMLSWNLQAEYGGCAAMLQREFIVVVPKEKISSFRFSGKRW